MQACIRVCVCVFGRQKGCEPAGLKHYSETMINCKLGKTSGFKRSFMGKKKSIGDYVNDRTGGFILQLRARQSLPGLVRDLCAQVCARACGHLSAQLLSQCDSAIFFFFLFMLSLSKSDPSTSEMLLPFAPLPISGPTGALLRGQLYLEVAVSRVPAALGACSSTEAQKKRRTRVYRCIS